MKTLIFLRHGRTNYTGEFPDLTEAGIGDAEKAALFVKDILNYEDSHDSVQIISSPSERAKGTAAIIAENIGYTGQVVVDSNIKPSELYNQTVAQSRWRSFP